MEDFNKHFNKVLNGRTEVQDLLYRLTAKHQTEKFAFCMVDFLDPDEEDEELEVPGYQVYLYGKGVDVNYKYLVLEISLSAKGYFPVEIEFFTLSKKTKTEVNNLTDLEVHLENIIASKHYNAILKTLDKALFQK